MAAFLWFTPGMADNHIFGRHMVPGFAAFTAGAPIESMAPLTIASAFIQSAELYTTWCGRFTGNLAVFLLFLLPHAVYVCFAATCSVLYLFMLHMLVAGVNWREALGAGRLLGLAAFLWVGLPSFGSAFFWLSVGGYIALMGQALFLLPYRFALDAPRDTAPKSTLSHCILFFLGGIVVASLDYPSCVALPVASMACVVFLHLRQAKEKRHIPWTLLCGAVGVSMGAAITLLAPGNAGRMALTTDPEVHAWLASSWGERIMSWLLHLPEAFGLALVPLALITWACTVLWRGRGWRFALALPSATWLFLLPAMATVGSYMFTAWPPARAFNTVAAQLIVVAMLLKDGAMPKAGRRMVRCYGALRLLLCVVCLASVVQTGYKLWLVHGAQAEREAVFAAHKGEDVSVPPMPVRGDSHMVLGSHLSDVTPDPAHWLNRAVAAFYGLRTVTLQTPAPREFVVSGSSAQSPLRAQINGNRLHAIWKDVQELHFYYFGVPALLYKAPDFICYPLLRWLGEGREGDWRLLLVPILLARTDVTLRKQASGEGQGESTLWGIEHGHGLWLVRPGGGAASFDIIPLQPLE